MVAPNDFLGDSSTSQSFCILQKRDDFYVVFEIYTLNELVSNGLADFVEFMTNNEMVVSEDVLMYFQDYSMVCHGPSEAKLNGLNENNFNFELYKPYLSLTQSTDHNNSTNSIVIAKLRHTS